MFATTAVIYSIVCIDSSGIWMINQVTLNLHVIREKFTTLGQNRREYRNNREFQLAMYLEVAQLVKQHLETIE